MSIGGIDTLISIAVMLVVWNAPVIMHRDLFCIIDRVESSFPLLDLQKDGSLYVAIGHIAPMYICLACIWCIPLIKLPSSLSA